jgi:hypothetical protein
MSLNSSELSNVDGLFKQLQNYDRINVQKEAFYTGKNIVKSLGIAIDPKLVKVQPVLGWPSTVVDVINERINLDGWLDRSNSYNLQTIFRANELDLESTLAHRDALIYGVSFLAVGRGFDGEADPLITVESPKRFTASYDLRKRRLDSALSVTRDGKGNPISGALYLENETVYLEYFEKRWYEVSRDVHNLGRVPVARIVNNPRTGEVNGSSEITPAVKELTESATRTIQHMSITSEFFSAPKYALLAAAKDALEDSDGNPINALNAITGQIWDIPYNSEDGQVPQLQQLNANSPAPFIEQLNTYAQLLAQATGIPANYLGRHTDNPTSADALRAMETRLIKTAENKMTSYSRGWLEAAKLALLVRDGSIPADFSENVSINWRDASQVTQSAAADATQKLIQAGVLLPDSEVTYNRLGFSDTDKLILTQEKKAADAQLLVANLAQAANAAAGEEVQAGE